MIPPFLTVPFLLGALNDTTDTDPAWEAFSEECDRKRGPKARWKKYDKECDRCIERLKRYTAELENKIYNNEQEDVQRELAYFAQRYQSWDNPFVTKNLTEREAKELDENFLNERRKLDLHRCKLIGDWRYRTHDIRVWEDRADKKWIQIHCNENPNWGRDPVLQKKYEERCKITKLRLLMEDEIKKMVTKDWKEGAEKKRNLEREKRKMEAIRLATLWSAIRGEVISEIQFHAVADSLEEMVMDRRKEITKDNT